MPVTYTKDPVAEAVEQNALGEQGIQTGSAANSVGYRNYLGRQDRSSGVSGSVEIGPFGKKFVGAGLLLFGFWIRPDNGATSEAWIIPGICFALGALGMIKGMLQSRGGGSHPFAETAGARGRLLRSLWFFRPRPWLLAWVVIIGVFVGYGSPHLRITYGPSGCEYFGLNGWVPYGVGGMCPLVEVFPLRSTDSH